jgi:transposase
MSFPITSCMKNTMSYKKTEQRRLAAMALLEQGWSGSKVARHFGVTSGAISQWKTVYQRYGPDGLKATPHTGRPPKLTASQLKRLGKLLLQGPEKHGYANGLWTLSRVAVVIKRHFGIPYDASGVWHVLARMGWSCQKPERRARERNEDAIVSWKKNNWPRIKKLPKKR